MRFREYNPYPTKTDYGSPHIRFRYYQFRAHPKWLWDIMRNSEEVCNMLSVTQLSWKGKMEDKEFKNVVHAKRMEKKSVRRERYLEVVRINREKALDKVREKLGDLDMGYPITNGVSKKILSFDDEGNYTIYEGASDFRSKNGIKTYIPAFICAIKAQKPYVYRGLYWTYRYKYIVD